MVDLFATPKNHRLPLFCSTFPDQRAWATDVMMQNWSGLDVYAFPPFGMVREVLKKLQSHQSARMTLIAPFWPRKEWFPELLELLVDFPRLLPTIPSLLRQPHYRKFYQDTFTLALTGF